jgi:hypothetical protein
LTIRRWVGKVRYPTQSNPDETNAAQNQNNGFSLIGEVVEGLGGIFSAPDLKGDSHAFVRIFAGNADRPDTASSSAKYPAADNRQPASTPGMPDMLTKPRTGVFRWPRGGSYPASFDHDPALRSRPGVAVGIV